MLRHLLTFIRWLAWRRLLEGPAVSSDWLAEHRYEKAGDELR